MIRYATPNDIPALKALWKQAFGDDDAFIAHFFEKRVNNRFQTAIVLEEAETLISMVYALPCQLRHGPSGTCYRAVNLVGVATDVTQRKKGYMRMLLEGAFAMLQAQEVEAVVLKPSNPQFYEKFGFHICNTLYQVPLDADRFAQPSVAKGELPAFLQQRERLIATDKYQILRSREDWEFLLDDGACICLQEAGYAVCEAVEAGLVAYEMVPMEKGIPCGYTMYKKIGRSPELPEDIGRENLIFEWY